jgi:hypothetical protein
MNFYEATKYVNGRGFKTWVRDATEADPFRVLYIQGANGVAHAHEDYIERDPEYLDRVLSALVLDDIPVASTVTLTTDDIDQWLRAHRPQMDGPFFYSPNMLRMAKHVGLDVDRLKADGIIAETARIPTK